MAQTNINIRIDEDLKRDFDRVCSDLGLTMSAAFNVFAKAVARRRAIPFEITADEDPFFSEVNKKRLLRALGDLEAGRNWHEHELIEPVFTDLRSLRVPESVVSQIIYNSDKSKQSVAEYISSILINQVQTA